ncbi:disulfide reductase [Candidatus Desantisbacteria bacterium CG2_30_40_21]|uniref:Disulfide reductase n=2 Tax=unclassified Candidatus Desantisiibacteriota TaxID=3106372 RepID=A0A2H0A9B2_9BACT|nr:MAG: disulfide reductase [Candidatus Desantisbacteria bacterium CG2_30_40_21]PIP41997.1 MAG: disulfide reductase [Candidatus Desantisbacteria bacterium CG23_combo_of_CG06-09_8_20_14_all_40_23]
MTRIGVFICHCGSNIAGVVEIERVVEAAKTLPGVQVSMDYKYMCSDPGQNLIINTIKEQALTGVVVGSCSPRMHERTFRATVERAGLNPYMLEIANIREHVSWVHSDNKEAATDKAIKLIEMAVAKARRNEPISKMFVPIEKRALVIGGGIAGIQAALDIAEAGFLVTLVEKEPSIGGRMAQLDKTFPTLDCSACILTPKMVAASQNKNITLMTYSEIVQVHGVIGNFDITIKKKARLINASKCIGCGICTQKCPSKKALSEFNERLEVRKAIYTPFPQAVPNIPVIDKTACTYFQTGKCKVCEKVCPAGAIDYSQEDEIITEKFGAIVIATGFDIYDHSHYGEYGYGEFKDVITSLQFERLINSSGPTDGHVSRPSDGKDPKIIVFIQCVGSRDDSKCRPYCSRVCCMYTAKQAMLLRDHYPETQSFVFYMDIRAGGKGYEEFVQKAQNEYGVIYLRGRVSRIYEKKDKLIVKGADTLSGRQVEIEADLVVLANGLEPKKDAKNLAQLFHVSYDQYGFYNELHPKLAPVETAISGVFLAGTCQGPKDIPDTVAQASASAAKVIGLLSKEKMEVEPMISIVNQILCSGCETCFNVCPYKAIEMEDKEVTRGNLRHVAKVLESVCKGCGACVGSCYSKAIDLKGFTNRQMMEEIKVLTQG